MELDDRLRYLCAQLMRTDNPEVVQVVAEQLKTAIDEYVATIQKDFPTLEAPLADRL